MQKKAEAGFGIKLIEKSRGGHKGGETRLTDEGRALMDLFLTLKTALEAQAAEVFDTKGLDLK